MVVVSSLLSGYLYQNPSKATPFFLNAVMGSVGVAFYPLIKEPTV